MLDHLDDIRSDFSVFHRVDVIEALPARRFFAFVRRLPHYDGVMRNVVLRQMADNEPAPHSAPSAPQAGVTNDDVVATSVDLMAMHPVWGAVGSFSKAPLEPET